MSIKKYVSLSRSGFTLVELLIVVAIIGVLASQGVPAYKRMIQKSRKAEAKVALANIATAEAAFFSEYGEYGNNIQRMGAQMDTNANLIYTAGFPASSSCTSNTTVIPSSSSALAALANGFSGYFTAMGTVIGNTSNTACNSGTITDPGSVTAISTYTAAATGFIRTAGTACSSLANCDQWTINQTRTVNNVVDGVGN